MVLEPDTGRGAREEAEPQRGWTQSGVSARGRGGVGGLTSIGEGNKCKQGRWALKGVDCEILVGEENETPL